MNQASIRIVVMAGGTGGHVYPALAVAQALRARGHQVSWMGAPDSFESRTVPAQGFEIDSIRVSGLRGKGWRMLLSAPFKLLRALADAWFILRRKQPQVVLGMGGFAAGPGGLAAFLRRTPLVIHEQNAAPGLTNRLLARLAQVVLQAFPDTFAKGRTVGNPVRAGFAELAPPQQRLQARSDERPHLLVLGGSQGAKALNQKLPQALQLIDADQRPLIRHQAGRTIELAQQAYADAGLDAQVEAFIDDMPAAFAWADLVVCRAGASTIAEICASGVASVLVPFPFAVDDHQTRNARQLVDAKAALLMPEADLNPAQLASALSALLADRARLIEMASAARAQADPDTVDRIADYCIAAARGACA